MFISLCLLLVELNIDLQWLIRGCTNVKYCWICNHCYTFLQLYCIHTVYLRTNEAKRIFRKCTTSKIDSICLDLPRIDRTFETSVPIVHERTMCEIIAIRSIRRRSKTVARNGLRSGRNRGGRKREGAAL